MTRLQLVKPTSIVTIIALFTVTIGSLTSCSSDENDPSTAIDPTIAPSNPAAIEATILNNVHAQGLIAVRNDMSAQVQAANPDIEALRAAYLLNDEDAIRQLMGLTVRQIDSLDSVLTYHRLGLLNDYPELEDCVNDLTMPCQTCNIDQFFDEYDNYMIPVTEQAASQKIGKGMSDQVLATAVECNWPMFFASMIVCGATGPIVYWPCAYVVICSTCEGGWVEDACGRATPIVGGGNCSSQ